MQARAMMTTITERGQTVVPAAIRRRHGLTATSRLEWIEDGDVIHVVPIPADSVGAGRGLLKGAGLRKALLASRGEDRVRE